LRRFGASDDADGNKSLLGRFSSEKEQESSYYEEKEAKRLLFRVLHSRLLQVIQVKAHTTLEQKKSGN
jgi:hypothetical protein